MPILLCQCIHRRWLPADDMACLTASVRAAEEAAWIVPDLCLLAEQGEDRLGEFATAEDQVVVACSERAVRALFCRRGLSLPEATRFISTREHSLEAILAFCGVRRSDAEAEVPAPAAGAWVPWFPVLEAERCTRCGQCAEFCLFDVYDRGENGLPEVARPRNCKDNCPACARICPVNALVFPKASDPDVSGSRAPEDVHRRGGPSMADILRKGASQALRQRRREHQQESMVRDDVRQALEERARCAGQSPEQTEPGEGNSANDGGPAHPQLPRL